MYAISQPLMKMKLPYLLSLFLLLTNFPIYAQQVELYDATSDAVDFFITVMVPLLAISLFETKRRTERNIFTLLDDFIIYSSFLIPLIYFYFYSIKTGTTHTLNFAVACALFFALILLLFEFLLFMKEDCFR